MEVGLFGDTESAKPSSDSTPSSPEDLVQVAVSRTSLNQLLGVGSERKKMEGEGSRFIKKNERFS